MDCARAADARGGATSALACSKSHGPLACIPVLEFY
jgi:hypothetical protein